MDTTTARQRKPSGKMSWNFKDLTGQKFGNLLVLRRCGISKDRHARWECVCDCGNTHTAKGRALTTGNTQRCPSCRLVRLAKKNASRTPTMKALMNSDPSQSRNYTEQKKVSFREIYRRYRGGAQRRDIEWGLSQEEVSILVVSDCHYCGADYRENPMRCNGIDRLDSNSGYTAENCVPCCTRCNYFKGSLSYHAFIGFIERIYRCRIENKK